MSRPTLPLHPTEAELTVLEAIRSLQYGSVEVIVHDSRVVQVDCKRKIRLNLAEENRDRRPQGSTAS